MTAPTASIQLIVFGERNQSDLPGVLRDVKAAGFPAFEGGNLFLSLGEEEARRVLGETGLRVSGAHFGYADYADPEKLARHAAYAQAVGAKHLMCSGVADTKTADGYRRSARLFNEVGKRLADLGLTFQYHNHAWEFDRLEGEANGMDILAAETDPNLVKFNLDVFWLWYAGQDPAAFVRAHADRAGYFHFKDGRRSTDNGTNKPEFLELGQGEVDLKAAYAAVREVGASFVVAEQDRTTLAPAESARVSRAYLRDALQIT